ncbi:zf-DHHC-domain-containing protein [Lactarius akahatsu]|uniref:Palmitoyltransferase n=1 Tax=Lactarius akahatsu TaxID=416441 RepID=A0AAD4QEY6_9AGAM|nr:zf-DHHC-domain-containing protein [Lactarius akahatsu]
MGRLLGRLVVAFTTALICFISYTPQLFIIWPWYGRELSIQLLNLLIPFNILVGLLLYNYYLCITTDPGRVPHGWEPEFDDMEGYEVKKNTGGPRFCRMCKRYKPPRAHHCKSCKRYVCVNLRSSVPLMSHYFADACSAWVSRQASATSKFSIYSAALHSDHHCPWVNNCVGFYNYGHFIRFLFFVDLACTYHVTMLTRRVFDTLGRQYWDSNDTVELLFVVLNYVTCVPVLLLVGGFSLYHFYCVLGNTTTIEGWEKDKVATLIRRGKIRAMKFPYNLGARRNVESMLGINPLLWCCPNVGPLGTGLKYQLAEGDGIEPQESWPPRDPTEHHSEWTQPSSPWTYENNGPNPALAPSNTQLRARRPPGASAVPPYHPDYEPPEDDEDDDGERYAEYERAGLGGGGGTAHVRRGSEGYEVRPIDREGLLAEFIANRSQEEGHYRRYDEDEDEDEPLAARVEKWRSGEAIA